MRFLGQHPGHYSVRWPLALLVAAIVSGPAAAETVYKSEHYRLRLVTVAKGLEHPWSFAFMPDGRILVTERPGRLRIVGPGGTLSQPVKGVPRVYARGQGGLLDVVLDPGFASNRVIYLSYAEPGAGGAGTAVARAVLKDGALSGLKVIFRQTPKAGTSRHFGSRLVIARDGTLFITVGERGQRERAQDPSVNRGQVVRINRDGTIPKDNPFVGKNGYRPEIWSYGHRNPQGAALHPVTGKLWTVEHGARGGDEINVPLPGRNYGWPVIAYGRHYWGGKIGEGTHKAGMEQPIHYWDPSIAPSGMAFYTGDKYPKWKGNVFVGALSFQLLSRLVLDGDKVVKEERLFKELSERIRDVRQGPDGYLYMLTDASDGQLLRIEPVAQ
jgi:glucose/arabinose dehydrogenase